MAFSGPGESIFPGNKLQSLLLRSDVELQAQTAPATASQSARLAWERLAVSGSRKGRLRFTAFPMGSQSTCFFIRPGRLKDAGKMSVRSSHHKALSTAV